MICCGSLQKRKFQDGWHYGLFCRGNYYDLMDNLNCQLTDRIYFSIGNGRNFFKQTGRISRKKNKTGVYKYVMNKKIIDDVFENFCGNVVEVELKNMEVE
jgi:hypothetical protein